MLFLVLHLELDSFKQIITEHLLKPISYVSEACMKGDMGWGINLKGEGVPRHAERQSRSALIN